MPVMTGLDILVEEDFASLGGRSIGLLCNQASISKDLRHVIDLLLEPHRGGRLKIQAVFGPEHGLWGHTQDNMIEWEGEPDPRTGLTVHSLYGKHREPTDAMLEGIDLFLVDIPDVGARYYTFIWTMALCMKACARMGISVMVLDRPNPIGGMQVEGPVMEPGFASFVGLYPLPARHGMTVGEIALYVRGKLPNTQHPIPNTLPINILTICNTGGLATSGHGTALGIIRTAFAQGKNIHVYSCETRPRMQGLRLTAWELSKDGIPFHSIADGVAGSLMRAGKVDLVIAGADRIAANGDAANKIGTYSLAVLARHHGIPFYIAAPSSTFDPSLASGDLIPIEERDAGELTELSIVDCRMSMDAASPLANRQSPIRLAPESCPVFNPAFDVTPGDLIDAIVSEKGVHTSPYGFTASL